MNTVMTLLTTKIDESYFFDVGASNGAQDCTASKLPVEDPDEHMISNIHDGGVTTN